MNWLLYALLGMFFAGFMILIFKKLTIENVKAEVILVFLFGFAFIFYLSQILITKTPVKINSYLIFLLILAAFFSYLANLLEVKSIGIAPNPAFPVGIFSLHTILVVIGSYFLFNSSVSIINILGIILGIIAIILLSL
ncbi:MAG: EamA family transporter [Nanoarchaeota archaeon]